MPPLRVLCLDIEGGFGGSSRSLYESLRHIDRARVAPTVWCRRAGPVVERYQALDIPVAIRADMPKFSALPRLSRNILAGLHFVREWRGATAFRFSLSEAPRHFDLVHFNIEALFATAVWLRKSAPLPATLHVRTNLVDGPVARRQCRAVAASVDRLVFITENEQANFIRQAGRPVDGTVIYNIAEPPDCGIAPRSDIPRDGRFVVACLANYAWVRGIDRLVDLAVVLARRGRRDVLFIMAGDMRLTGSLPGELSVFARRKQSLSDYAAHRGVADMFMFLGHVAEPETVLLACDLLAKPTRENNPWGRDILEALAAERPVLSVGRYDRFVEDGVTGILLADWDDEVAADRLCALAADRETCRRMGGKGRARVTELCNGPARAADLLALWENVARR